MPVVFSSPHSGLDYPAEFLAAARLDAQSLRRSEDSYVDELFQLAPALGAPLIAFEIVSEFDRPNDLDAKVEEYFANGSAEVWMIYPKRRHAWVYESSGTALKETRSIHSALLPGVDIPLDQIL